VPVEHIALLRSGGLCFVSLPLLVSRYCPRIRLASRLGTFSLKYSIWRADLSSWQIGHNCVVSVRVKCVPCAPARFQPEIRVCTREARCPAGIASNIAIVVGIALFSSLPGDFLALGWIIKRRLRLLVPAEKLSLPSCLWRGVHSMKKTPNDPCVGHQ
jgi:hypothetical protein